MLYVIEKVTHQKRVTTQRVCRSTPRVNPGITHRDSGVTKQEGWGGGPFPALLPHFENYNPLIATLFR